MKNYIITFGFGHTGLNGISLANGYCLVPGDSMNEARNNIFRLRGDIFSFSYDSPMVKLGSEPEYNMFERYGMIEFSLYDVCLPEQGFENPDSEFVEKLVAMQQKLM